MKKILLTQEKFALVDDEDYDYLNQFKWCATKIGKIWYAKRGVYIKETQATVIVLMHRVIMNVTGRNVCIDHIDHDGLNNQRNNLRLASHSQNISNMLNRSKGSSKYLGVYYNKKNRNWVAEITKNYIKKNLGSFSKEVEAAKAYNVAAKEMHGEFANPNIL